MDFDRIVDGILANITWLLFVAFWVISMFSRGKKNDDEGNAGNRPPRRIERKAEPTGPYASDNRRRAAAPREQPASSPLFGGAFDFGSGSDQFTRDDTAERDEWRSDTKFGFDETEWGSTFDRNEEQYGWGDRKSSDPVIEVGGRRIEV